MTQEEMVTKLMEQLAATQEVDHAQQLIDAVNDKASTQGDLIRAACGCTKEELLRVFSEITGRQFAEYVDPALGGCEYESLDVEVALHLDTIRGHKEFLVKPFEEKYELVMNAKGHDERCDLLNLFSTDEVYAMADKLGVTRTGAELWMNTVNRVRFLVQEKLDRLEQSADVKDTVSVEASESVQVEVIDTPEAKESKTQKGRKTMTKATVQELRATAKAYGLKGYSKLNKAQLEELIRKHESTAQAQQEASGSQTNTQQGVNAEQAATSEISSYVVGKQIAVLKGNAKAQQALLKDCGDEFLLAMHKVFSAPVRVTMEDPNELRKYMCRDVLKAIRTPDYARFLLASVRADLKKDLHVKRAYLEGWERFLSEYVPAMSREEKLEELRRQIRFICSDRYWVRFQLRDDVDEGRSAIYAQLTREGKELLRQYMELKHSQSKFAPVISPDYDSAFDEPAYIPDYQENLAALDDVPESRILDTQEVGVSYEDVRRAYMTHEDAMDDYFTSHQTDIAKKDEADAAYREYLRLLVEYRKSAMPKREAVFCWLHVHFDDVYIPAYDLAKYPREKLVEMSHACGIHATYFGHMSKDDMAVRLLREAGIKPGLKTDYECAVAVRKEIQRDLHEVWQQRHVLRKALRLLSENSEEARILEDMFCRDAGHPANSTRIERMLEQYRRVCRECADGRKYEAENKGILPAPVQEVKPAVAAEVSELEVQVVLPSKPKALRVYRKRTRTPIRKSHAPSWVQSSQLSLKTSKHSPNRKPLVKLTKTASTVRLKKF